MTASLAKYLAVVVMNVFLWAHFAFNIYWASNAARDGSSRLFLAFAALSFWGPLRSVQWTREALR